MSIVNKLCSRQAAQWFRFRPAVKVLHRSNLITNIYRRLSGVLIVNFGHADLVTITEEILHGKHHFLCSDFLCCTVKCVCSRKNTDQEKCKIFTDIAYRERRRHQLELRILILIKLSKHIVFQFEIVVLINDIVVFIVLMSSCLKEVIVYCTALLL